MRLIDADALKERLIIERDKIPLTKTERYSFGVEFPYRHGQSMRGGIRKALRCMEQTPTIEAEPVRHGRWRLNNDGSGTCSECHFTQKNVWDMDNWQNYCGVCGAKMDKEV